MCCLWLTTAIKLVNLRHVDMVCEESLTYRKVVLSLGQ
jgi:hypothetical protein